MNTSELDRITHALLYEGYILYPYRASCLKNQRERFTFGRVYPQSYSVAQKGAEPCEMQTQCLVLATGKTRPLEANVRFLQPMAREIGELKTPAFEWNDGAAPKFELVPELRVDKQVYRPWHEAVERMIVVPPLRLPANSPERLSYPFRMAASCALEPIRNAGCMVVGVAVRSHAALEGVVELAAEPVDEQAFRITVRIVNITAVPPPELNDHEAILMRTFASAHTILHVPGGEFLSSMDPPQPYKDAIAACKNIGAWPVLVGDELEHEAGTMLSSPIILYDYPKIAPQSAGDLCDGTEIDELLTLRIRTMTDSEKIEMNDVDQFARKILERSENMSEERFMGMHGNLTRPQPLDEQIFGGNERLRGVAVDGVFLKEGDRVRLRPKPGADVMDLALRGQVAVIEAVEQDAEGKIHLAVVLENDPGKDLGMMRQPGHRFFFGIDEVEPLPRIGAAAKRKS